MDTDSDTDVPILEVPPSSRTPRQSQQGASASAQQDGADVSNTAESAACGAKRAHSLPEPTVETVGAHTDTHSMHPAHCTQHQRYSEGVGFSAMV